MSIHGFLVFGELAKLNLVPANQEEGIGKSEQYNREHNHKPANFVQDKHDDVDKRSNLVHQLQEVSKLAPDCHRQYGFKVPLDSQILMQQCLAARFVRVYDFIDGCVRQHKAVD